MASFTFSSTTRREISHAPLTIVSASCGPTVVTDEEVEEVICATMGPPATGRMPAMATTHCESVPTAALSHVTIRLRIGSTILFSDASKTIFVSIGIIARITLARFPPSALARASRMKQISLAPVGDSVASRIVLVIVWQRCAAARAMRSVKSTILSCADM